MEKLNGTAAHPGFTRVPLMGGAAEGKVRPWTMAQRAELKPALGAIIARVEGLQDGAAFSFPKLIVEAEEELLELAMLSLELPEGTEWNQLFWEDLPNIIQAIWETNIVTGDGGGLGGKLMGLLAPVLNLGLGTKQADPQELDKSSSEMKIEPAPSSQGSPS